MTLRSYLIPQAFPESRIPSIYTVEDNSVPSTATHSFAPPLHLPNRIPFQISLDFNLPCKIHVLLSELLSNDKYKQVAEAPASNHLVRNYGTLQDFCESHRFHVSGHQHDKEPSVTQLAVNLANPVCAAYRDLTGEAAISDSQVRTNDGAVKSDRTYSINDKVAILWEDKALPVFRRHMGDLLNTLQHGDFYFRNVGQQSWEGVEAILAKITYHTMNQDEADRPSWSIIFGGDSYMILFLAYTADSNDKQRIAIFCSGILSIYHKDDGPGVDATRKLPVCSAIVYMLLSTHDAAARTTLQEKLGVRIQHPPSALPDGLGKWNDGTKYSRRLQPEEPLVGVQGPGSTLQILSLVGTIVDWKHDNHFPHIFLDQLWGPSGTAVVYKSSHARLVVKFSLTDRQERLRSERGLLVEKQVYEHLKDKGLSFIPQYFGLYAWPGGTALIISDEGESLADTQTSFKALSWLTR